MQIRLIAVAAALACAGVANAGVAFDANYEGDVTKKSGSGVTTNSTAESVGFGGRIEINAKAEMKNGDNFVTAKGSLLLKHSNDSIADGANQTAVDDAWIQFGNSSADFKIGRHEAVDLFPVGKDTVLETAGGAGYRANALRGRVTDGRVHAIASLNASNALRIELGVVTQDKGSVATATADGKPYGVRPTLVYTAGDLTLRAGFESFKQSSWVGGTATEVNTTGTGLSAGYVFSKDSSVNVNYAKSSTDNAADNSSFGVNAVFGAAGVGYIQDKKHDLNGAGGKTLNTLYAAYSFPLMGVKGATVTPAFSRSTSSVGNQDVNALRVRFNYAF